MDNDKQVKDIVQGTRDHFLNQPLQRDDPGGRGFDLEGEFAKSAKNRSVLIPVAVVIFLVLLGVGAWVASQFTDQASQKSTVSIGSFEDLKLKEIFDTARKNKRDLEEVQNQIGGLTEASKARVVALQQAGASKADIASVNDPSGSQAKAILDQTGRQIAAEKASLAKALQPLVARAAEIQKKIDSYDSRIGDLNKKNQQVLDSQQRLFDLEKKKLTDDYEAQLQAQADQTSATVARLNQQRDDLVNALKAKQAEEIRKLILKYNPVISDPILGAQLDAAGTKVAVYPTGTLPDRIASHNLLSADQQSSLAARVEATHQLLARLKAIPFENSVPPLLNTLDNAIADSLSGYDGYLAPLAAHMSSLDDTIAQLKADLAASIARETADTQEKATLTAQFSRWTSAVDQYVAALRDWDGVLVDTHDPADSIVILKADRAKALSAALAAYAALPPPDAGKQPPAPVNLGTVRDGQNNNELGVASVEPVEGGWKLQTVRLSDSRRPFKPFDRIVLNLPGNR